MARPIRLLLLTALLLLVSGWFLYHLGSQLNLEAGTEDQALWEQAPGDKWLYGGGLMMLISGSLAAAAVKICRGIRRDALGSSLKVSGDS
jgi:hypothetical protein